MATVLNGWSEGRVREATSFVRGRVIGDAATAGLVDAGDLLWFRAEEGEVFATAFGGQHDFPIELQEGPEAACAIVMDQVQDGVIDRLGRPWPELLDDEGRFTGVLEPRLMGGIACWGMRGVPFCAVGHLSAAIPAAGLRLARGA